MRHTTTIMEKMIGVVREMQVDEHDGVWQNERF